MKKVLVKKGTRICSVKLGGCGRVIKTGEYAWRQIKGKTRVKRPVSSRLFICEECYDRVTY